MLKHLSIWVSISTVSGFLFGIASVYIGFTFLNVNMNNGFAFVVVGVCLLAGLGIGIVIGYRKYKRTVILSAQK